jgi:dienelactone hydrolase
MDAVRDNIRSFLKLSLPVAAPAIRVVERKSEDGYTRSLIRYSAQQDGDQIEAFLFQPTAERPRGKVLALHQHNSQWMIGKSEIAGMGGDPLQAFGPALARLGVTVLAPDAIGFESRLSSPGWGTSLAPGLDRPHGSAEGWLQHYNQMAHRLVQGDLLMRKVLSDCAGALSVLQNFEQTDTPVGVLGHSYGGMLALFLAALDTRVAFACSSGAASSFRYKLAHGIGLEMSLIIPGFAQLFDLDDLIRCVAPRRLLLVSSDEDPLTKDADQLVRAALSVFEAQNCVGHLQHFRFPGSHALDQERFQAILEWTVARSRREQAS